jgi:hypothetical protein
MPLHNADDNGLRQDFDVSDSITRADFFLDRHSEEEARVSDRDKLLLSEGIGFLSPFQELSVVIY